MNTTPHEPSRMTSAAIAVGTRLAVARQGAIFCHSRVVIANIDVHDVERVADMIEAEGGHFLHLARPLETHADCATHCRVYAVPAETTCIEIHVKRCARGARYKAEHVARMATRERLNSRKGA